MYKIRKMTPTSIRLDQSYEGETIEQKINRMVNNKEPIKDSAALIYTERKDGVKPEYDIRTDRFDLALDAMDSISKTRQAKRNERIAEAAKEGMKKETPATPPIQPNQET